MWWEFKPLQIIGIFLLLGNFVQCWPVGCDNKQPSFTSALNRLLDFTWLLTNHNQTRNILYEINFCETSTLCPSLRSKPVSVCRVETNGNLTEFSILGYQTNYQIKNTSDGFVLKIKGEKCDKFESNTEMNHMTYIYFSCAKTMGRPTLLTEGQIKLGEDEEHLFDEDEENNVCKTVFKWNTNQACNEKRFSKFNEIPCYLTLNEQNNEKESKNGGYSIVDFSKFIKSDSSGLNNFHQVIEFNDEIDVLINVCRYSSTTSKILKKYFYTKLIFFRSN